MLAFLFRSGNFRTPTRRRLESARCHVLSRLVEGLGARLKAFRNCALTSIGQLTSLFMGVVLWEWSKPGSSDKSGEKSYGLHIKLDARALEWFAPFKSCHFSVVWFSLSALAGTFELFTLESGTFN